MHSCHRVSDVLRGVEEVPQELHPPLHSHELLLLVLALERDSPHLHLPVDEPVLRLCCYDNHPAQLRLPGHDRHRGGGRVSVVRLVCVALCETIGKSQSRKVAEFLAKFIARLDSTPCAGAHPEFSPGVGWRGAEREAIYNLCFFLKNVIKIMS